ncbi:MAG: hypothetical protein M1825_004270 [Sarcosagium campestre]|nr:MAG: hypothetical protein M1825_004270 [Sarcosagium campestre]
MSSHNSASPGEDYFNDLNQELPSGNRQRSRSPSGDGAIPASIDGLDSLPRPKRIACVICRKRKLKCDGSKPSCSTCSRLGHDCAYDEVRRKSGPKRGYVKALEARLAQVENLLKTQDPEEIPNKSPPTSSASQQPPELPNATFESTENGDLGFVMTNQDGSIQDLFAGTGRFDGSPEQGTLPPLSVDSGLDTAVPFHWELIGLGVDEPLPNQDVIDDLQQIYFSKIHPSLPMIHRRRFCAAMNLAPHHRPPVCLRYAMWCNAASVSEKYADLTDHFYQRARKYIELDEMKGHGENMITLAHAQCWSLIATYEFKMMYFPKAWMSTGRATRLCQMMGLHRLDGVGLDVKQCLPPPRDWTEREERRRTFWMAFCQDRYASIGTGWPMVVDERDILTSLPASEEAYDKSKPQRTMELQEAMTPNGASSLSSFAGVILMACLFGRNLIHLHRPGSDDRDHDLKGEFWKRHHQLDNILLNTVLSLPSHLRLPAGLSDSNIVFLNMNIHTSTICLHQAAIFKADKHHLHGSVIAESKVRCITAAAEIASIMRMISHLDLCMMNPFISFCLYVSARVFIQFLKSRPDDDQVRSSLQFLVSAMHALKKKNPLTESFLVQLDVDLDGAGLDDPKNNARFAFSLRKGVSEIAADPDNVCIPIVEIREKQASNPLRYNAEMNSTSSNSIPVSDPSDNRFQSQSWPGPTSGINLPNRQKLPSYNLQATSSGGQDGPGMNAAATTQSPPIQSDMDLSPDNSASSGGSSSADMLQPSPTLSNTTSKHTPSLSSYTQTPPSYDVVDPIITAHGLAQSNPQQQYFRPQQEYATQAHPVGLNVPATATAWEVQTPGKEAEGAFVIPPGWELGSAELPPTTEGMFSQMMEMGWAGSDLDGR